jgi:hypothetical protein
MHKASDTTMTLDGAGRVVKHGAGLQSEEPASRLLYATTLRLGLDSLRHSCCACSAESADGGTLPSAALSSPQSSRGPRLGGQAAAPPLAGGNTVGAARSHTPWPPEPRWRQEDVTLLWLTNT